MNSKEFFNILDDIDDRIVSEIYEDVQRPQKLAVVPNSHKRLPKLLLGSAACLAVIAAAGLAVKFAAPGAFTALSGTSEAQGTLSAESDTAVSLSQTSETVSANDSGSVTSEGSIDWFSQKHTNPWRRTDTGKASTDTWALEFESEFYVDSDDAWSPEDYEIIASDNGTVVFAGEISEPYGSSVIVKYAENAYVAFGGLDTSTVTVSAGDSVTEGDVLGHPKAFTCMDLGTIVHIKTSRKPITEEYFQTDCYNHGMNNLNLKNHLGNDKYGAPDADGYHHIKANSGDRVRALEDGVIFYAGTDSEGSGMVIMNYNNAAVIVYRGLDTSFPEYYTTKYNFTAAVQGETIGYVGNSGDAYWFVLTPIEFGEFAEKNGIDFYPTRVTFKHTGVDKP